MNKLRGAKTSKKPTVTEPRAELKNGGAERVLRAPSGASGDSPSNPKNAFLKSDFFYELPPELIAQTPFLPRDGCRMLVCDKTTDTVLHKSFYDLPDFLRRGDVVVLNTTRVINARLYGFKQTGAKIEILLLKRLDLNRWEIILKPYKRVNEGTLISFGGAGGNGGNIGGGAKTGGTIGNKDGGGFFGGNGGSAGDNAAAPMRAEILRLCGGGRAECKFIYGGVFEDILNDLGQMPLPHYIKTPLADRESYQTVYSKIDGSAAAPTAGLHFTRSLIEKLKAKGVIFCEVILHVGLGTFRPVKCEDISRHKMHSEYYEMPPDSADVINKAKREGRRVIAVGTTSLRVLESVGKTGAVSAQTGDTDIFIYPPYEFKIVDALITNFHLPESTLIMLVSAFAGVRLTKNMYAEAIAGKYRFFSFGDATFIF
jgi:S-adenosylmethionine:tRNA ribosyltransferase-isomerase